MKSVPPGHPLLVVGLAVVMPVVAAGRATAQEKEAQPGRDLKPVFGVKTLQSGFVPDPFKRDLIAGGDIRTSLGGVRAWVGRQPDVVVDYTAGRFPLTFYADSRADTTLLVNLPDGSWLADDDSGGNFNPMIKLKEPKSGRYTIWVGTYLKAPAKATLYITELPWIPQAVAPAGAEVLFSVAPGKLDSILSEIIVPHQSVEMRNGEDKTLFRWKLGKYTVALEGLDKGKILLIGLNLTDYKDVPIDKINKWNDEKSLSRAILRSDARGRKYPRLESDLNCELGVNPKSIDRFIKRFYQSVDEFKKYLRPAGEGREDARRPEGRTWGGPGQELGLSNRSAAGLRVAYLPTRMRYPRISG